MDRLKDLLERTRKEIMGAVDPDFIHNRVYFKKLPSYGGARYLYTHQIRIGNFKHYEVMFEVASATYPGEKYQQKIVLLDLNPLLKDKKNKMTFLDKVRYAINDGDILLFCPCAAHLFWGYRWIDTKLGIVHPDGRETRPPNIRNPQRRGIICKHLQLALQVISFYASDITRDVKEQLGKYNL